MIDIPVHEVTARLKNAAPATNAVVAFDCDGTLWSGDVGEDWFAALVEEDAITAAALEAIRAQARAHDINPSGDAQALARAIEAAMRRGAIPEQRVYEIMAWASAGRTVDEERAIIERTIERARLPSRVQRETLEVLVEAQSVGLSIVAVSASPRAVVLAALARIGLAPRAVCAATQAVDGDALLPSLSAPLPYRAQKVHALRAAVGPAPVLVALGDSAFDLEMLALAEVPLAVRPKPGLRERAHELPALRELSPR